MKISTDGFTATPKKTALKNNNEFGIALYGEISENIKMWLAENKLDIICDGIYKNIYTNKSLYDLFYIPESFKYLDGFSPNLNKKLHIGHMSNFVLANAFKCLKVAEKTVAILGDIVAGELSKDDSVIKYNELCNKFEYSIDKIVFASDIENQQE